MKMSLLSFALKQTYECRINSLIVRIWLNLICVLVSLGQMVLKRNATCGWQIKKPSRRQHINGAWRTCSGSWTLMDQETGYLIHAVETRLETSTQQYRHFEHKDSKQFDTVQGTLYFANWWSTNTTVHSSEVTASLLFCNKWINVEPTKRMCFSLFY